MSLPEKCFACGKKMRPTVTPRLADTRDDQTVYVGPDCFRKVQKAGEAGYPLKGLTLRLYPMAKGGAA